MINILSLHLTICLSLVVSASSDAASIDCGNTHCVYYPVNSICTYFCVSGVAVGVPNCIVFLHKKNNCTNDISVFITKEVRFENNTIPARWFQTDEELYIDALKMDLEDILYIDSNAFMSRSFSMLITLALHNINLRRLSPEAFNGLVSLSQLTLTNINVPLPNCLQPLALRLFVLDISTSSQMQNRIYDLEPLIRGTTFGRLFVLKVRVNAKNTITANLFLNSTTVTYLDLEGCQIEVLDRLSFMPLRRSLVNLNLANNRLKTLPIGMLSYLVPSEHLVIELIGNPWNCECHLVDLQRYLRSYRNNFNAPPTCNTPWNMRNQFIHSTPFCGSLESDVAAPVETRHYVECPNENGQQFDFLIMIKNQYNFSIVNELHDRSVSITLTEQPLQVAHRFVIFTWLSPNIHLINNCECDTKRVRLENALSIGQAHVVCLQDPYYNQVLPLYCTSFYYATPTLTVWLKKSNRTFICIYVASICTLIFLTTFLMSTAIQIYCKHCRAITAKRSNSIQKSYEDSPKYAEIDYIQNRDLPPDMECIQHIYSTVKP